MKSQPIIRVFILFSLLICILSCKKDETPQNEPITISVESATDITETSFKFAWSATSSAFDKLIVQIAHDVSFEPLLKEIIIDDHSQTNLLIQDLDGATNYKYRIKAVLSNGNNVYSNHKTVTTSFETESVRLVTSDGYELAAKLKYLQSQKGEKPGIIFMHELGIWVNNWQSAEVVTQLIAQGYACLVFDFRGHGQSDDYPLPTNLAEIEAFVGVLSHDLSAALNFMNNSEEVDGNKLALVGGSMGGMMAIAGNGYDEVKSTVALSASQLGVYSIFPNMEVSSAFFIAGALDVNAHNVSFGNEATNLYNNASEPKKLKVYEDESAHGTELLLKSGLNEEIIDWINTTIHN
jgi:dienelactone hydrolase